MNLDKFIDKLDEKWKEFFIENRSMINGILNSIYVFKPKDVFPEQKKIFRVFKYVPPEQIKVVLLGQDPYIGSEIIDGKKIPQAEGLSFSVPKSHSKIPPSLLNMFKEIKSSYPDFNYENGNLKRWVKKEKIFLLNTSLTVSEGKSNSHQKYWSQFTDEVIKYISDVNELTVFILMGNNAKLKMQLIDKDKHVILTSVHPSPLSANRGFFGCKIFEKTNEELIKRGIEPINWTLNKKETV